MSTSPTPKPDRLFVPLASGPFEWFLSGAKTWELRRLRRSYTEKHVRVGRAVELRRGYSTLESIWAVVSEVVVAQTIEEFFEAVDFKLVIPLARDLPEACVIAQTILGENGPVIGFECLR